MAVNDRYMDISSNMAAPVGCKGFNQLQRVSTIAKQYRFSDDLFFAAWAVLTGVASAQYG
jgi:hypothetical protein